MNGHGTGAAKAADPGQGEAVARWRLRLLLALGVGLGLAGLWRQAAPPMPVVPLSYHYRWFDPGPAQQQPAAGLYRLPKRAGETGVATWLPDEQTPARLALFSFAPISINRADSATLTFLPGIGPALAERIVQHREQHGPFREPAELQKVRGIGPKTFARIKEQISL